MLSLEIIENEIAHVIAHGNDRSDIALLADLYVCRSMMKPEDSVALPEKRLAVESTSEFASCVNGRCFSEVLPQIEEFLDAVKTVNPRLYDCFITRLR